MDITQRAGDLQVPATSQTSCAAGVADVQLVLCAGAPDTKEIQTLVTELVEDLKQTRDNVIWVEKHLSRAELIAVLSAATVFACPSIYEPLGIVNLEAMACGIPVVATATGGIPEVVAHEETGLLVPIEQLEDGSGKPLDETKFVADFAGALNRMLAHPQIKAFGEAGRRRVEQHFSWDRIAQDTIEVYRDAIENFA
jgi:starch synthase